MEVKWQEWSAWVYGKRVASGNGGVAQAAYYARQYVEEGEVVVREGYTKRGSILFRVYLDEFD